jgi:hypothetical protein
VISYARKLVHVLPDATLTQQRARRLENVHVIRDISNQDVIENAPLPVQQTQPLDLQERFVWMKADVPACMGVKSSTLFTQTSTMTMVPVSQIQACRMLVVRATAVMERPASFATRIYPGVMCAAIRPLGAGNRTPAIRSVTNAYHIPTETRMMSAFATRAGENQTPLTMTATVRRIQASATLAVLPAMARTQTTVRCVL